MADNTLKDWTTDDLNNFLQKRYVWLEHARNVAQQIINFEKEHVDSIFNCRRTLVSIEGVKNQIAGSKETVDTALASIQDNKQASATALKTINSQKESINDFHEIMFYSQNQTDGNPKGLPITEKFEELHRNAEDEADRLHEYAKEKFDLTNNDWEKTYNKLKEKIESLFSGAAAFGLAEGYFDAKNASNLSSWFFLLGFLGSLMGLGWLSWDFINSLVSLDPTTTLPTDPKTITLPIILMRLSIGTPLIWFAWFCQKNFTEQKKIKEEYHHKQRIMSLYDGFAKQIQNLSEIKNEELKKLVNVMLDAIKVNPADIVLNKGLSIKLGNSVDIKKALKTKKTKNTDAETGSDN